MSAYPFWLLSFDLRDDLEPHVLRVLCAVGRGDPPDPTDLGRVPPAPRFYLEQPRRMQSDQGEPVAGTPVRVAHSSSPGVLMMTVEFAQHDDEFANGGWRFWLWVLSLARRPRPGQRREVLGHHGLYRGDSESQLVYIAGEGVTENGRLVQFSEIDRELATESDGDFWP